MRSIAAGEHEREPEPAVAGEALLRREVVDVEVGRDRRGARRRPTCASTSTRPSAPGRRDVGHHAGGRLVVRVRVGVDGRVGDQLGVGAGLRLDARPGRRGTARRAVTAANFDENSPNTRCSARRSMRPKAAASQNDGAAAVAEQHLVAVGQREQVGEPGADATDDRRAPRAGGGWCRGSVRADVGERPAPPRAAPSTARIRSARRRGASSAGG